MYSILCSFYFNRIFTYYIKMKNYQRYKVGDKVIIIATHKDDLNQTGVIIKIHHSYCKIRINNKIYNHTYSQFKLK